LGRTRTTAARASGKTWGGRKPGTFKVSPAKVRELADKGLSRTDIARALGVHRRTVARMLAVV
jgi:DNA invertase Pin-like site-specific DNA recombinase